MFTELSTTSSSPTGAAQTTRRPAPEATSRRPAGIALEVQSAWKFVLAFVLGASALWVDVTTVGAAALIAVAVVLAARALTVLAADPAAERKVRPREEASWDGGIAIALAVLTVAFSAAGHVGGAAIAGAGALVLAGLRLRTRYVAG